MNTHFTRLLKINHKLREFNFRKLPALSGILFHVDVTDDRGARIIFKMQKEDGAWRLVGADLPPWISDAQGVLGQAIDAPLAADY